MTSIVALSRLASASCSHFTGLGGCCGAGAAETTWDHVFGFVSDAVSDTIDALASSIFFSRLLKRSVAWSLGLASEELDAVVVFCRYGFTSSRRDASSSLASLESEAPCRSVVIVESRRFAMPSGLAGS